MTDDPLYDPMAALKTAEAGVGRRGEVEEYNRPTDRIDDKKIRKVTTPDAKRAGSFDRKTLYISPEMIRWAAETAAAEGVGVLAFYRFLLASGKDAYESGRARPEPAAPLVHRLKTDVE